MSVCVFSQNTPSSSFVCFLSPHSHFASPSITYLFLSRPEYGLTLVWGRRRFLIFLVSGGTEISKLAKSFDEGSRRFYRALTNPCPPPPLGIERAIEREGRRRRRGNALSSFFLLLASPPSFNRGGRNEEHRDGPSTDQERLYPLGDMIGYFWVVNYLLG